MSGTCLCRQAGNEDDDFAVNYSSKLLHMRWLIIPLLLVCFDATSQQSPPKPCATDTIYRQFDFWIGEWEVYGPKGKAGTSRIDLILDSCIILENWTSARPGYAGKSFNTYNQTTKQWQQTWVDNSGGSTEYLRGQAGKNLIVFYADKNVGQ